MKKRAPTQTRIRLLSIALLLWGLSLLVSSCNVFGDYDNKIDPGADNYQGHVSAATFEELKDALPALSGGSFAKLILPELLGATEYEVHIFSDAVNPETTVIPSIIGLDNEISLPQKYLAAKRYYYQFRAKKGIEFSPWSDAAALDIVPYLPASPSLPDGGSTSDTTPTLSWVAGSETAWVIQTAMDTPDLDGATILKLAAPMFTTENQLDSGTTLYWRVAARTDSGLSGWGKVNSAIIDTIPPANPSFLIATTGNTQVNLSWTNPSDTEYSFIEISWTPTGGIPARSMTVPRPMTSQIIADLVNGMSYTFTIKAVDKAENKSDGVIVSATLTYSIGYTGPAGGFIFYDKGNYLNGWRWLEAAPRDQSTGIAWCNGSYNTTGAMATAVGQGEVNTLTIISVQGEGTYAASLCANYILNGFDDWFLPSKDELNLIYVNLKQHSLGGFASAEYWSSSEYDYKEDAFAFGQDFRNGNQWDPSKFGLLTVRAVRAFNDFAIFILGERGDEM
jgi:hypothetical protein